VLSAGFVAPYGYERQNRDFPFAPPMRVHFIDEHGRFHARPFAYGLKTSSEAPDRFTEDRSVRYPMQFFVSGATYNLLGIMRMDIHLFGVAQGNLFLLGTDNLGRDVLSRLLYGAQISMLSALLAAATSATAGLVLGGVAGYYGRWLDEAMMRIAEVFLSVPWLYLLLAIRAFLPLHLDSVGVFLLLMSFAGVIGWARPARLVRGVVLSAKSREYVLAARGFGASDFYLLRTHVLPQAYAVALTQAALYIPQYITAEVTLSFFGLGVSEPAPSLGNMLAQLRTLYVLENCWWMFAPAAALVLVLLAFESFFRLRLSTGRSLG
jgi:peptide/nickel transport system permease protein